MSDNDVLHECIDILRAHEAVALTLGADTMTRVISRLESLLIQGTKLPLGSRVHVVVLGEDGGGLTVLTDHPAHVDLKVVANFDDLINEVGDYPSLEVIH